MAPSSSPSPSPPTAGDAPRAAKKRKTASAPRVTPVAERTPSRCSLCSFAASTLDHLLTHVREAHRGTATTCHMALALDVGQMLIQYALASGALAGATSEWLEDMQRQYAGAVALRGALQQDDARAAADKLRAVMEGGVTPGKADGSSLAALKTLQHAVQSLLDDIPADKVPAAQQQQEQQQQQQHKKKSASPSAQDAAAQEEEDDAGNRASEHEEAAAEALTGLRRMSSTGSTSGPMEVSKSMAPASASASSSIMTGTTTSSGLSFASFPSNAAPSPLTITAPPPTLFHAPELFSPSGGLSSRAAGTPVATPGASALPSLFSRRVSLAPLSSPATGNGSAAAPTHAFHYAPMPGGEYAHQQVAQAARQAAENGQAPAAALAIRSMEFGAAPRVVPEGSPTSLTPVFYRPFAPAGSNSAALNANTAANSNTNNRQSPVHQKRKSLTSKHLSSAVHTTITTTTPSNATTTTGSIPAGTPTATFHLPNGRTFQVQLDSANTPTDSATPTTPTTPGGSTLPAAARKATPRRWTKEEDEALRQAVESHREKNWKAIAAQVPGRNHTQCLQRWTKVLAPGLVKGHWSPHEDELLRRLVATEQKNWGEVAAKIPGRTSKQCRERWHNHLDPSIVRGAYTPEEDRIILEAQARLGNRWSVIAAMLPGRTEDAVKIRWKSHCRVWRARKYLRKGGNSTPGGGAEEDGGETPRTPLVGLVNGEFVWPTGMAPLPSPTAAAAAAGAGQASAAVKGE